MKIAPLLAALVAAASLAVSARAQTMFFDDFEAGLANWSTTSLWRPLSASSTCGAPLAPFPSGTQCAWFGAELPPNGGAPCSFDDQTNPFAGPSGTITMTTPVQLSGTGRFAWLRYQNRIESEGCSWEVHFGFWDVPDRFVSIDGGATWIPLAADCNGSSWHKGRADLTPYLGEQVLVRFRFRAEDAWLNHGFGWLIDDVQLRIEPGKPECDASSVCPCGNYSTEVFQNPREHVEDLSNLNLGGCTNSLQQKGELWGSGVANMSEDSLVLHADLMPPGVTALVFQGNALTSPIPLADGTTCVSGALVRLRVKQASLAGTLSHPTAGDQPLSATAGAHVAIHYQVYYRNAATFCTPATFNTTNAYGVPWGP
ncbi:MAG: hypothetical protein ACKVWV_03475 [Planctomycetota bacterium]